MPEDNNGHYEAIRNSLGEIHKKIDEVKDDLVGKIHALEIELAVQKTKSTFIPIALGILATIISIIGGLIGIIALIKGL